jgi:hypothetical protein
MPFENTFVAIARQNAFVARFLVLLAANLVIVVVMLSVAAIRPRALISFAGKPQFWYRVLGTSVATSLVGATLLSLFPPGGRVVPLLCLIGLAGVVEWWVKRNAERRQRTPAA